MRRRDDPAAATRAKLVAEYGIIVFVLLVIVGSQAEVTYKKSETHFAANFPLRIIILRVFGDKLSSV